MNQSISRAELHENIRESLPMLRRYALSLCRNRTLADDLVQDTAISAIDHSDQFAPGSNFQAWISTILRNNYLNELRRCRWLSYDGNSEIMRPEPSVDGSQEVNMELRDLKRAFDTLYVSHRQALLLVGASGLTYAEAAEMCGTAVGTMKSRVWRARAQLRHVLEPAAPVSLCQASAGARKNGALYDDPCGQGRGMHTIKLADAKAPLSELVDRVEAGDSIDITRRGKRVARPTAAVRLRKRVNPALLQYVTATMPPQTLDAADLVRSMRDGDRC